MNIAGPSRPHSGRLGLLRESVESTYEEDLLRLLAELNVDEMDEMQTFFTQGASGSGPLSDHDIAMSDLLQQARALAVFNEDRALAQRIAAGEVVGVAQAPPVWTPAATATAPLPANQDRTEAQRNGDQAQAARNDAAPTQTWGGWLSSIVGWAFGPDETTPTNTDTAAPRNNRPTGHDCVICQDPIHGAEIRAPCGHYYDIGCITDLFQSATRDESLYPPRCCRQNIPFTQVQLHLSRELITTFQQKQTEFSTLKRVYCSSPTCSRFLGPLAEGFFASRVFTCPAPDCGRRTCAQCRQPYNDLAHVCRPDADAAHVLELGRNSGWARCPGCSQMIELNIGCYHMTCRCRTEFCYLCRARWKTCRCPQWDERRLLVVAEERVDAQLGVGRERVRRVAPVPPARPVPVPVPGARRPLVPVENAPANRTQAAPLGARLIAPVQRRAAPAPPPTRTTTVQPLRPQPTPVQRRAAPAPPPTRTTTVQPLASSNAGQSGWVRTTALQADERPASIVSTSRNPFLSAPTSTSARASTSTSAHAFTSASASASTSASTSTRASISTSASASTSARASSSTSPSTTASRLASVSVPASYPRHTGCPNSTPEPVDTMRQRMVREMMDRLRVDHECNHGLWRYRHGGGICQMCGQHLPLYLFRCLGCEFLACNRCRRNRL